jgi:dipeptidyl aminopeptidase/acylaminoacyl peptidase
MTEAKGAPYGSWNHRSPDLIVSGTTGLGSILFDGGDLYWIEVRYSEGGRYVIVRRTPDGQITDILPAPYNARTRVHEYGGRAYLAVDGTIFFTNFSDQRLYVLDAGSQPRPITPQEDQRYADYVLDRYRNRLICVREDHTGPGEAVNTLVAIDLAKGGPGVVLFSGNDFYSSPRLSPDGTRLAWLAWNHPNLPWDGTELWLAEVQADGSLGPGELVAGGTEESIFQPEWSPDGVLYFVSDKTGWWNLYRFRWGQVSPVLEKEAEFGQPQWVFGMSMYGFDSPERIVCQYIQGSDSPGTVRLSNGRLEEFETPFTDFVVFR